MAGVAKILKIVIGLQRCPERHGPQVGVGPLGFDWNPSRYGHPLGGYLLSAVADVPGTDGELGPVVVAECRAAGTRGDDGLEPGSELLIEEGVQDGVNARV